MTSGTRLTAVVWLLLVGAGRFAEAGEITGCLSDTSGLPLPAATVRLMTIRGAILALKTAEADGCFRLTLPVAEQTVDVQASAPGTASVMLAERVATSESIDVGTVELPPGRTLEGRVVDQSGRPVAGAEFTVLPATLDSAVLPGRGVTDAAGNYVVNGAPDQIRLIEVRAPGFIFERALVDRGRWVLRRGGTVEGQVTSPDGTPMTHLRVAADDIESTTDASGHFRIDGLPFSPVAVRADNGSDLSGLVVVSCKPGQPSIVADIRLDAATSLNVTVTDDQTGGSISGASLRLYQGSVFLGWVQANVATASTDSVGRARLIGVPPGRYVLVARRFGYLQSIRPGTVVVARAQRAVTIPLTAEARISGLVKTDTGRPVAGARITLRESSPFRQVVAQLRLDKSRPDTTRTDRRGRFVLRGLAAGRGLNLEATSLGFATTAAYGIDLTSGQRVDGVSLVLRRGLNAFGRVVNHENQPVSGASIRLTMNAETSVMPFRSPLPERPIEAAVTGPDGRFVLADLESATYSLQVSAEGYSVLRESQFRPHDNPLERVFILEASAGLTGAVTMSSRPVSGARVSYIDPLSGPRSAVTGADGRFAVQGLSQGDRITLRFEAVGAAPLARLFAVPGAEVIVELTPEASIRGRVIDDATGTPVTDFSIDRVERTAGTYSYRFGPTPGTRFHDEDGRFELLHLPQAPSVVVARAAGFAKGEVAIGDLAEPPAEDLIIRLKRGLPLHGRVVATGTRIPVSNVSVSWRPGSSAFNNLGDAIMNAATTDDSSSLTDDQGRFAFENVPDGALSLLAMHPDYAPGRIETMAHEGLEIVLGSGAVVSGIVTLDDAGAGPGVSVSISPRGAEMALGPDTTRTDADGGFRFTRVRPGNYTAEARSGTGASVDAAPLTVKEGDQITGIVLSLRRGSTILGRVTGLPPEMLGQVDIMAHADGYYDRTTTDADGVFILKHLPAGATNLLATTSFQSGTSVEKTIVAPPEGGEIAVELEFGGQSRLVGVVTRGGRPVADLIVAVSPKAPGLSARGRAQTDGNGRFEVAGLQDGEYQVLLRGPGLSYQRAVLVSGLSDVDIRLPAASVRGVVKSQQSDEPLENVTVMALNGRERSTADVIRTTTDSSGAYVLSNLDPGAYQIRAIKAGYRDRTWELTAQESPLERNIVLVPGGGLTIRVREGLTGGPLAVVTITALDAAKRLAFRGTVQLDTDGRGEIPSLDSGLFAVTFSAGGFAPQTVAVELPRTSLEVLLTMGGRIELRAPEGVALKGMLLNSAGAALSLRDGRLDGWLDVRGPLTTWPNVPAGVYQLKLQSGTAYPIEVTEGTTTTVMVK